MGSPLINECFLIRLIARAQKGVMRRNYMVEEGDIDNEDLVSRYRREAQESISDEAELRTAESMPMKERIRLRSLSLVKLTADGIDDPDLVAAIFERLGPVRAALDGHGGGIVVASANSGRHGLEMVLDLTGACLACGSAPGTLAGVRSDLEEDAEIASIKFSAALLDTFDDLGRQFVLAHGGVEFVDP